MLKGATVNFWHGGTMARFFAVVYAAVRSVYSLRPVDSIPYLLPNPPRGDAVGTVFGAEPSNCIGETFARVDARFTGAPDAEI
jgi:hypothetical protein